MSHESASLLAGFATILWCAVELRDGYSLVQAGAADAAQPKFQAAVFAGFLTIAFAVASGAVP